MQKNNAKKTKSKFSVKMFLIFLLFEVVFTGITLPMLAFYGPFDVTKRIAIGTLYQSRRGSAIVKFYLTPEATHEIMKNDDVTTVVTAGEDNPVAEDEDVTATNQSEVKIEHNTGIEYKVVEGKTYNGYLLIVKDPSKVKLGLSRHLPTEGELTSQIAKNNNAIAAINAGGFVDPGFTSSGGKPMGYIIHEGKIVYSENPNRVFDAVGINESGTLITGKYSANKMIQMKVKEAVCFEPPLIIKGKGTIRKGYTGGAGLQPRTAIGQRKEDGAMLLLVLDGRSLTSPGATRWDIQQIMLQSGAYTASNLDGGSSSTMYYDGKVINTPSDILGERIVPSAFIVEK